MMPTSHALTGNRNGQYAVFVSGISRIVFEFEGQYDAWRAKQPAATILVKSFVVPARA